MRWLVLAVLLGVTMTDIYEQPEDAQPLTLSPDSLVDAWGDPRFSDVDDPAQESWTGSGPVASVGAAFQSVLTSGVANGDFAQGPPDPNAHLGDENRLPGWSFVVGQGGGIYADWIDDSSAPAGKAIRWTVTDAVADDEAYLEQVIPVSPRAQVLAPELTLSAASTASSTVRVRIYAQPLKNDGTTTGSEASYGEYWAALTDGRVIQNVVGIPSDARFLRIRLALYSDGTFAGPGTVDMREAWAGTPTIAWTTITGSDIALPATGTRAFYLVSGGSSGTPAQAAERYIAPAFGWVAAISVRADGNVTGAAVSITFRDETFGANVGPSATIAVGADSGYATGVYDATTNRIEDGNAFRFQSNVPTGTLTSTGRDIVVVATIGLLVFRDGTS